MRVPLVTLVLLTSCSRVSKTDGPEHLVQTVEHQGLTLEIRNHVVTYHRTRGLTGAGRGFDWVSPETSCGVEWSATLLAGSAKKAWGNGVHAAKSDCEKVAESKKLETCTGSGRIAFRWDHSFGVGLRFEDEPFTGGVGLGEGETRCRDALAESWDAPTLLAHLHADGGLRALLRSSFGEATVRAFLDHRTFSAGTSLTNDSVRKLVADKESASDDDHVRFVRALHAGADRKPDLEAALYDFLSKPPPPEPISIEWSYDRAKRALAFTPSVERRRAFVDRALGSCSELVADVLRKTALGEAIAQLDDPAVRTRAKACSGLLVPERPAFEWDHR